MRHLDISLAPISRFFNTIIIRLFIMEIDEWEWMNLDTFPFIYMENLYSNEQMIETEFEQNIFSAFSRFKFRILGYGLWPRWADECCIAGKTNANIIQTSSVAYDENIFSNQSQSRCKRLETVIAKDWSTQTSITSKYYLLIRDFFFPVLKVLGLE